MLFNPDMDRRLSDLHSALVAKQPISAQFVPSFDHGHSKQPDRLVIDITGTDRRLVFGTDMGTQLAEQIEANGFRTQADAIRGALAS